MCDASSVRNWPDQLQLKCRLPGTYRYPCLQQAEQNKKIHQGYEVRCFSLLKQHHVTVQEVHAFHSFPLSSSSTRPTPTMVPPPQIPPPSTSYDPWLKAALQKSVLRQVFSVSAVLCWLLAFFWSTWISASYSTSVTTWISTWFSFYSVNFAGMSWLLGSVPIVAAKKRFSTCQYYFLVLYEKFLG